MYPLKQLCIHAIFCDVYERKIRNLRFYCNSQSVYFRFLRWLKIGTVIYLYITMHLVPMKYFLFLRLWSLCFKNVLSLLVMASIYITTSCMDIVTRIDHLRRVKPFAAGYMLVCSLIVVNAKTLLCIQSYRDKKTRSFWWLWSIRFCKVLSVSSNFHFLVAVS